MQLTKRGNGSYRLYALGLQYNFSADFKGWWKVFESMLIGPVSACICWLVVCIIFLAIPLLSFWRLVRRGK
jgi:hypothetical protein